MGRVLGGECLRGVGGSVGSPGCADPGVTPTNEPAVVPASAPHPYINPDFSLPSAGGYGDFGFSPGDTPTDTLSELEDIYAARKGTFDLSFVEAPLDFLVNSLEKLNAETGIRFGLAYTQPFQQASGGSGTRWGQSGDLDLMLNWTLLGRGTRDTGQLVLAGEYRFAIGVQPPSAFGGVLGTLTNTTGGFSDRGWVMRDAYWLQRLFDDRLRVLIGRADPADFVGGTRMQSINNSFLNRAFSANASVAYPAGHGPTARFSIIPCDLFFFTGGASNAYGRSDASDTDPVGQRCIAHP